MKTPTINDWENPKVVHRNRLAARSYAFAYEDEQTRWAANEGFRRGSCF